MRHPTDGTLRRLLDEPAGVADDDRRQRAALRCPRVAAVAVVALLAGAGAAAAADWLQIFRAEQVAPIRVTQADLVKLPDLSSYGELDLLEVPEVREVDDAAAAEARTGLSVPQVGELPRGVTGEPTFQVGDQVVGLFTYSAEDAGR